MGFAILGRMSDADLVAAANRVIADYGWGNVVVRVAGRQDGVVDFELSDQSGLRVTHYALVEALTGGEAKSVVGDNPHLSADYLATLLAAETDPTEGERLARFFDTSAHEGHEAVRYGRPVVPRPDDRVYEPDERGNRIAVAYDEGLTRPLAFVYCNGEWSCTVYSDHVYPDIAKLDHPVVIETQGTLRAWEAAMRAGQ